MSTETSAARDERKRTHSGQSWTGQVEVTDPDGPDFWEGATF